MLCLATVLAAKSHGLPLYAAAGVSVSLLVELVRVENPAKIPLRFVLWRAMFGIAAWFFAWLLFSITVTSMVASALPAAADGRRGLLIALGLGALLPQVKFTQRLVKRSWYRNALSRAAAITLVRFTEMTGLYLPKIIKREERRAARALLQLESKAAIDHLYEANVEVIIASARQRRGDIGLRASSLARVRNRAIKVKALCRYFGAMQVAPQLHRPEIWDLFPAWPAVELDRRLTNEPRASATMVDASRTGRRRTDISSKTESTHR